MIGTMLSAALANLACVLERPTEASFILNWLKENTKNASNNGREDDDSVPNFDGWQNSPNSDFLKPGTYTLSTDSSQKSLEENKVNNMNRVYYDDDCDNELN